MKLELPHQGLNKECVGGEIEDREEETDVAKTT
jgi:hypothetical protein